MGGEPGVTNLHLLGVSALLLLNALPHKFLFLLGSSFALLFHGELLYCVLLQLQHFLCSQLCLLDLLPRLGFLLLQANNQPPQR